MQNCLHIFKAAKGRKIMRGVRSCFLTSNPSISHNQRKTTPTSLFYIWFTLRPLFLTWSYMPYAKHQQGRGKVNDKQKRRSIRWNEGNTERERNEIYVIQISNWSGARIENSVSLCDVGHGIAIVSRKENLTFRAQSRKPPYITSTWWCLYLHPSYCQRLCNAEYVETSQTWRIKFR